MMQVFTSQATDGTSAEFKISRSREFVNIWLSGVLDTATVTIEALAPDGVTWEPINGGVLTETQMVTLEMAPAVLRLSLSGATASTDINAWAERDEPIWRQTVATS